VKAGASRVWSVFLAGKRGVEARVLGRAYSSPSLQGAVIDAQAPDPDEEEVAEARVRLLASMKRYFHSKRADGLLSSKVGLSACLPACLSSTKRCSHGKRTNRLLSQQGESVCLASMKRHFHCKHADRLLPGKVCLAGWLAGQPA
jgi:hypothetical protein